MLPPELLSEFPNPRLRGSDVSITPWLRDVDFHKNANGGIGMIGIVILNAVLVALVLTAVVGILAWGIVSSIDRTDGRAARSRRARRRRRIAELKPDVLLDDVAATKRAP
jgi:hypothetical protein